MAQVVRYFHIRPYNKSGRGGATVRVVGDSERVGQVDVQATFCSKKDMYCKATGRVVAANSPVKVVPLRYLPQELACIQLEMAKRTKLPFELHDFTYSVRYFLPKE